MKKLFNRLLAFGILLSVITACYDDNGNYEYLSYDEVMPVKIDTIKQVSVRANEKLIVTPKITNDDPSKYTYMWFVISSSNKRDTLSRERDLSIDCNLGVDKYKLYFQVKDSLRDIYKMVQTDLIVAATDITNGWYVLKEQNGKTDIDYLSPSGTSKVDLLEKILNISPLEGKPLSMLYLANAYNHQIVNPSTGAVELLRDKSVYHILTDKSLLTLNANDLVVFKTLADQFYESPTKIAFQNLQCDGAKNQYLMNDGHLHSLLNGAGLGKFAFQYSGAYNFYPNMVTGYFNTYFYDQKSKAFYTSFYGDMPEDCPTYYGKSKTAFADSSFVMTKLIPRTVYGSSSNYAYAIVKGGKKDKFYFSSFGFWNNYLYPSPTFKELPNNSELLSSTILVAPQSASVIYYAKSNELKMYKVLSNSSEVLKTFASDETIGFIKNITGKNADNSSFNDLVVITNSTSGYKVYRFPLVGSAGEINSSSKPFMNGIGNAGFIMFREN